MAGFDLSNYVMVNERVAEFWKRHPNGRIITMIAAVTDDRVVFTAEVYRDVMDMAPAATGTSQLKVPGTTPYTKGSEWENAETSAVGRALGFLGIGSKDSIASREEVESKITPAPKPSAAASKVDPDAVTGVVEKVMEDAFALKAGMTRYKVISDSPVAVGDKVTVTGPVERIKADGAVPYKQITATSVTN